MCAKLKIRTYLTVGHLLTKAVVTNLEATGKEGGVGKLNNEKRISDNF